MQSSSSSSGSCGGGNDQVASGSKSQDDMISNLPDFVIGYILSFLSTKEAVLTSVLSTRWKYMWTFLTKLDFRDYTNNNFNSFSNFVTRVLFHLNTATIQEFILEIPHYYDPYGYYTNQWISAVLSMRLKKIKVFFFLRGNEPKIPSCPQLVSKNNILSCPLFECHESLEELEFMISSLASCIIKLPSSSFVSFSSLTVLSLAGIITFTSSNEIFQELTLNFPLLREYKAVSCGFSGVKSITIEAPLLELVFILGMEFEQVITRFSASRITNFSYYCDTVSHTIFLDQQNIPSSKIFLVLFDSEDHSVEEISIFIRKLLRFFINAEYLELDLANCWPGFAWVANYLADIPVFRMLGYLKLKRVTSNTLLDFLLKTPCLKTLVLQMVDYDEESQNFAIVPDCFLSTLKVVKFDKYFGGEREFSFSKFVMENTKVMERISFSFHKSCSEVEKAKEKLSLVKISFSTVIMEFST
ncbi:unnamed protein product [Trifolium pratense]|uniref:Uncharacterized protein n=1 Tax=Trifolium pratense TaxID=57577 RepID=A0ACB0LJF1_TRIPR|nr:unnamed protein product [Trifolium pratense]